jgi:hypothetical protein
MDVQNRIAAPRIRLAADLRGTGPRRLAADIARLAACASLFGVAACGPAYDPLLREGLWYPDHANRANLVATVANPADLVRGSSSSGTDGQLAAAAVERLRNDKLKPLPASDVADVTASSSGANNSTSGGTGGGTP